MGKASAKKILNQLNKFRSEQNFASKCQEIFRDAEGVLKSVESMLMHLEDPASKEELVVFQGLFGLLKTVYEDTKKHDYTSYKKLKNIYYLIKEKSNTLQPNFSYEINYELKCNYLLNIASILVKNVQNLDISDKEISELNQVLKNIKRIYQGKWVNGYSYEQTYNQLIVEYRFLGGKLKKALPKGEEAETVRETLEISFPDGYEKSIQTLYDSAGKLIEIAQQKSECNEILLDLKKIHEDMKKLTTTEIKNGAQYEEIYKKLVVEYHRLGGMLRKVFFDNAIDEIKNLCEQYFPNELGLPRLSATEAPLLKDFFKSLLNEVELAKKHLQDLRTMSREVSEQLVSLLDIHNIQNCEKIELCFSNASTSIKEIKRESEELLNEKSQQINRRLQAKLNQSILFFRAKSPNNATYTSEMKYLIKNIPADCGRKLEALKLLSFENKELQQSFQMRIGNISEEIHQILKKLNEIKQTLPELNTQSYKKTIQEISSFCEETKKSLESLNTSTERNGLRYDDFVKLQKQCKEKEAYYEKQLKGVRKKMGSQKLARDEEINLDIIEYPPTVNLRK